jgi:hypothetical protein
MKKNSQPPNGDLRSEYDFGSMKCGVRGKYLKRAGERTNIVLLDSDIAEAFPSEAAVNEALRGMLNTTRAVHSSGGLPNKALQPMSRSRRVTSRKRSRTTRGKTKTAY